MKSFKENFMKYVFFISALLSILAIVLICLFLFSKGLPAIGKIGIFDFILGREWSPSNIPPSFGILPMIMGSIYITLGAILVGVPIGILTAVFMARFCSPKLYKVFKPAIDLLSRNTIYYIWFFWHDCTCTNYKMGNWC